jgi:pyruvate dehydrogenase E2 component (dihydrolipoamide acetyltransferase)
MEILEKISYKGIRKIIGERMAVSNTYPNTYQTLAVDMDNVIKLRHTINEEREKKLSLNDFIVKAAAIAITHTPILNSALIEKEIVVYKDINIGVIAAVDKGLVAPVIKNTEQKSLFEIAKEGKELFKKARAGRLMPDDYAGGTFSISNVGMMGVDSFIPLSFPPQAAILGISSIRRIPAAVMVKGEEKVLVRPMMNIVLGADHRISDGVPMAKFNNELKALLEDPEKLL